MKKAAFLVYPMFCMYEMALTLETLTWHGKEYDVFSTGLVPVECEEGLAVVPTKTLADFDPKEYDCLLLSGIGGADPFSLTEDVRYLDFLRQFKNRQDILIGGISISPILLGKAGLLEGKAFCLGLYEEDKPQVPYLDFSRQVYAPIVTDGNVITAVGAAFRQFAIQVARQLGFDCPDHLWADIPSPVNPEDYLYRRSKETG